MGESVVILILLAVWGYFIAMPGGGGRTNYRRNTRSWAEDYSNNGEYQRALDLLDRILIENAEDAEAKALKARILEAKRKAEEESRTRELETLQAQKESLEQSLEKLAKTTRPSTSDDAVEKLLKAQQAQAERERKAREEEARKEEEARLAKLSAEHGHGGTASEFAKAGG